MITLHILQPICRTAL